MARIVLINDENIVVNVIVGEPGYQAQPGFTAFISQSGNIGDTWDGGNFISPAASPIVETHQSLMDYAERKAAAVDALGIVVPVTNGDALVDTSQAGRADINGLLTMASLGEPLPPWHQSTGDLVVTADDLRVIGLAVAAHRSAVVAALSAAEAGITLGSITTLAEIDALAWPGV